MARRGSRVFDEDPIDYFNRVHGKPVGFGRGVTPRIPNSRRNNQIILDRIARGGSNVPSRQTRAYIGASPRGGRSGGSLEDFQTNAFDAVYSRLTDQYTEQAQEQAAINVAVDEQEQRDSERPWWQSVLQGIAGPVGGRAIGGGGFENSIVGRGLDILSRPSYGLFEGLQTAAEHEDQSWSPSNLWDTVQEMGAGAVRGLTGENKTGAGQIYEALQNNPTSDIGGALRSFEESNPALEQATSIVAGLAGEVLLDPLNIIAPAAPSIVRATGEVANQDALTRAIMSMADEASAEIQAAGLIPSGSPLARNPQLLVDKLRNTVQDVIERSMVDVHGGGSRGLRTLNDRLFPAVVANRVREEARQTMSQFFTDNVDSLWADPARLHPRAVDAYRQVNRDFDEFLQKLGDRLVRDNTIPVNTTDNILAALQGKHVPRHVYDELYDDVMLKYDQGLETVFDNVYANTRNPTYRTPGIRIRNTDIPFKPIGRAYQYMSSKLNTRAPNLAADMDAALFERLFAGPLAGKAGQARSLGFAGFDEFRNQLREFAKGYTPDEAAKLSELLEKGIPGGNPKLDAALAFLRDEYRKIFQEEQIAGARPTRGLGSRYDPNYNFIQNQGGARTTRAEFKAARKAEIHNTGGAASNNLALAAQQGLKPNMNAFESLLARYVKSSRDMTRAHFMTDLVENYSTYLGQPIKGLSDKAIRDLGLTPVPYNRLNASLRASVDLKGGSYYLPTQMVKVADWFNEITSWSPGRNLGPMGRQFAKTINVLKASMTLPYFGFHMRNFFGDVAMGMLDDVPFSIYSEVARKWVMNQAGKAPRFNFVPGMTKLFEEMWAKFESNADLGFFETEFGTYNSLTAGAIPRRLGRRVTNTVRELSDKREMIPRFAHFVAAFREEARALWKNGTRDLAKIEQLATDSAMWRVNAFKFDYAALMPWEKKLKTLAFPFYTYMRKAIPRLIEQMYLNPLWFAVLNRFMEYNDGSAADGFNSMNIPQWIRDIGFANLTDEAEPLALTQDLLPMGALQILSSNNLPDAMANTVQNINPLALTPFELGARQTYFDDRPIDNTYDYLMDKIPILGSVQSELGVDIPGIPGYVGEEPMGDWVNIMNNRMFGAGIPLRRITANQQQQQQNENQDAYIDDPIKNFNYKNTPYYISISEDMTQYMVKDRLTRRTLAVFHAPQEAIDFAESLPNFENPPEDVSPYQPPTPQDVYSQMGR